LPRDLSGLFDDKDTQGQWRGEKVASNQTSDLADLAVVDILGDSTSRKRIEVDLTKQHLYAFEGDSLIYDFVISSGLYDWTPRGTFDIWIKLRYTKMEGGNKALGTYYYLPNVPYVMFFANDQIPAWRGFSLHGTYWHNDFGRPKSHGCINMKTADIAKLYYWAQPYLNGKQSIKTTPENPGTKITIYGKYRG